MKEASHANNSFFHPAGTSRLTKEAAVHRESAYPSRRAMQMVYRSPIWLYRLGWGPLVGRLFMILTTTGRKSGLPRRTAMEFHQHHGRKYVMVGWRAADWYKNILANPLVTVQTAWGTEHARARRITTLEELRGAWEVRNKARLSGASSS
jgi:deazaflavin-dependent oxidoreductase (nitroreductase family)